MSSCRVHAVGAQRCGRRKSCDHGRIDAGVWVVQVGDSTIQGRGHQAFVAIRDRQCRAVDRAALARELDELGIDFSIPNAVYQQVRAGAQSDLGRL